MVASGFVAGSPAQYPNPSASHFHFLSSPKPAAKAFTTTIVEPLSLLRQVAAEITYILLHRETGCQHACAPVTTLALGEHHFT